nr:YkgJ family cysteine cluster protein [Desulfobulbaceae bacterium]
MTNEGGIFQCRECGFCCHGETTVSLDENDLNTMASYIGLPIGELKKRYLRETDNVVQMKIVDGHCIFFNGGCTIHPGKPWRCTQWPLHPSILQDRNNFETIKASCPGISKSVSYEEFCEKLKILLQ